MEQSTATNINGFPAKYVLTKNPSDATGQSYVVAKVLDIPERDVSDATHPNPIRIPSSYMTYDYSETPLHLCNPASLITQHRRSDHNLAHRVIDVSKNAYTEDEMQWYADPEAKIPPPMRLVMIYMLRCYLCGDFQKTDDDIHYEGVGQHAMGYRYCTECRPHFIESLYKTITPILKFRREYEAWLASTDKTAHERPFIWVARTRRDENGQRIVKGNAPYTYMKWRVINWITRKHRFPRISPHDGETIIDEEEDCLVCEQIEEVIMDDSESATITKLVPLRDIYIVNLPLLADPVMLDYDPNNNDPLNQYSDKEQRAMFAAAVAAALT